METIWTQLCAKYPGLPAQLKPFQVDAMQLVRDGSSVVLGVPTGQGKTLPLFTASLGTGKVGLIILPLLNLEAQMEKDLTKIGISYVNMSSSSAEELRRSLASTTPPEIILTNVEAVGDKSKRDALRRSPVTIGHIAWDEAMVMDETEGWGDFRIGYGSENRKFLAASFPDTPWILASATLDDEAIVNIATSLGTTRDSYKVLHMNPDRANIFYMDRKIRSSLKIGNIDSELSWLLPILASGERIKCQIFVLDKDTEDLIAAWLRLKCEELSRYSMPKQSAIAKMSGDDNKEDKDKIMTGFLNGQIQVLVSTDCAGMGVHVPDLRLVVNIGIPRNMWKLPQTFGRVGRDRSSQAVAVQVYWPGQKGGTSKAAKVRDIFMKKGCRRKAINDAFTLSDVHRMYESDEVEVKICLELSCTEGQVCRCTACLCCSVCSGECGCVAASRDSDFILQQLLFVDEPCFSYKGVKLAAARMIGLDDLTSSSSDELGSASSADECFPLYD